MIAEQQAPAGVIILYRNYRGEASVRRIRPERIWYGTDEWHTSPQWFIDAMDLEKQEVRSFAVRDISQWSGFGDGIEPVLLDIARNLSDAFRLALNAGKRCADAEAERDRLKAVIEAARPYLQFTEQGYCLAMGCGRRDGSHAKDCAAERARKLLEELR